MSINPTIFRSIAATADGIVIPQAPSTNEQPIALPLGREAHIRRRYDRKGRLVDYAIVLVDVRGRELVRADMAHGTPEIHRHGGDARSSGAPIRIYTEVTKAFDRDYDVVLGYDR